MLSVLLAIITILSPATAQNVGRCCWGCVGIVVVAVVVVGGVVVVGVVVVVVVVVVVAVVVVVVDAFLSLITLPCS